MYVHNLLEDRIVHMHVHVSVVNFNAKVKRHEIDKYMESRDNYFQIQLSKANNHENTYMYI